MILKAQMDSYQDYRIGAMAEIDKYVGRTFALVTLIELGLEHVHSSNLPLILDNFGLTWDDFDHSEREL
jgi:hypothetical protein